MDCFIEYIIVRHCETCYLMFYISHGITHALGSLNYHAPANIHLVIKVFLNLSPPTTNHNFLSFK